MKRFKVFCFVGVLVTSLVLAGQAADGPSAATRAYLYQRETRKVLTHHRWQISQDRPGRLAASRLVPSVMSIPFFQVALLTITFQSDSSSHTKCAANIVADTYERGAGQARKAAGPIPYNTPETTREIQVMVAEAEKQLTTAHPEYAKR